MAPNPESGPSIQPPLDRDIGIDMGAWEEGDNAAAGEHLDRVDDRLLIMCWKSWRISTTHGRAGPSP
jgi:hypothetical protein